MHYAAGEGHVEVAKYLACDSKVDLHAQNVDGLTPLFCAVQQGHQPVVRLILTLDATTLQGRNRAGDTPLHYAAVADHGLEMSKLLLEFGADISCTNDEGDTPLLEALMEKRFEVANLFKSVAMELKNAGPDANSEAGRKAAFARALAAPPPGTMGGQDNQQQQFEQEFKVIAAPAGGFTDIVGSGVPQKRARPEQDPTAAPTLTHHLCPLLL
jgi:hypothetical protein